MPKIHHIVLTDKDKARILELKKQSYTKAEIATATGIPLQTIHYFLRTK